MNVVVDVQIHFKVMSDLNNINPHNMNVIEISCDHIDTSEEVNVNNLKDK